MVRTSATSALVRLGVIWGTAWSVGVPLDVQGASLGILLGNEGFDVLELLGGWIMDVEAPGSMESAFCLEFSIGCET